jgi:hypothetical protein
MKKTVLFLFGLIFLITSCTTQDSIQKAMVETLAAFTPIPTQTAFPSYTPFPTQTPYPTFTPLPTYTQAATQTPWVIMITATNSATPTPSAITADDVIAAFKAAGLEAENTRPLTKDDYGLAPYVCKGIRFFIPSMGVDKGGRLFICDNNEDRDSLKDYYEKLGKASAAFFSWVFVKGNVLVQINGNLAEDIARKYEQAIP